MSQTTAVVVILLALAIDQQKPFWLSVVGLVLLVAALMGWAAHTLWRQDHPSQPPTQ